MNITRLLASAAALAVMFGTAANAQQYPDRPITLVVPFATGGGTDVTARMFADAASRVLGQAVVVENRPGAGGVPGTAQIQQADPDGYTLLWTGPSNLTTAPSVYKDLPYDPVESFALIARAMEGALALVVNDAVPATNVAELVEYAKGRPGDVNYGSAGVGSIPHLGLEVFNLESGADMVHIPYAGNGPAQTALMAGEVEVALMTLEYVSTLKPGGPVRALAVSTAERNAQFPDMPTIAEAGVPGYEAALWYGLAGPKDMPQDVIDKLVETVEKVKVDARFVELATNGGFTPIAETPAEFKAYVAAELQTWAEASKAAGIEPQ